MLLDILRVSNEKTPSGKTTRPPFCGRTLRPSHSLSEDAPVTASGYARTSFPSFGNESTSRDLQGALAPPLSSVPPARQRSAHGKTVQLSRTVQTGGDAHDEKRPRRRFAERYCPSGRSEATARNRDTFLEKRTARPHAAMQSGQ